MSEPTKEESGGFNTITDVLTWPRVDGDPSVPGSRAFTLLDVIGADALTDIAEVANIDPDGFGEAIEQWCIGEPPQGDGGEAPRPATAIEKGRARAFHRACRIAAGLEWSSAETEAWEWAREKAAVAAEADRTAVLANVNLGSSVVAKSAGRSIKVADVADVTKAHEAPLLDKTFMDEAFREYKRKMWVEPRPEQEPSVEQLSALVDILKAESCYVDLGIWGPHGIRIIKAKKLVGLILLPNGEFGQHEFKGPPDLEHWLAC